MKKSNWPDLCLRERIAHRQPRSSADVAKLLTTSLDSMTEKLEMILRTIDGMPLQEQEVEAPAPPFAPQFLSQMTEGHDGIANVAVIDIEDYAKHVKTCSNCKSEIAKAARRGVIVPEKLLVAAGIDVLKN